MLVQDEAGRVIGICSNAHRQKRYDVKYNVGPGSNDFCFCCFECSVGLEN